MCCVAPGQVYRGGVIDTVIEWEPGEVALRLQQRYLWCCTLTCRVAQVAQGGNRVKKDPQRESEREGERERERERES